MLQQNSIGFGPATHSIGSCLQQDPIMLGSAVVEP